jgi:hypothetical protein
LQKIHDIKQGWSFSSFSTGISKAWEYICKKIASLLFPQAKKAGGEFGQALNEGALGSKNVSPEAVA